MEEFSTNEVAQLIGVDRATFYEWHLQGYVQATRRATGRGNTALFDREGVIAAEIFSRMRNAVRRPFAGRISSWYQTHGHKVTSLTIVCGVGSKTVVMGEDLNDLSKYRYALIVPVGPIRVQMECRIAALRKGENDGDIKEERP